MNNLERYLFRGISQETGEWVYGNLYNYAKDDTYIIVVEENPVYVHFPRPTIIRVLTETIGQYTGLCDVDGVKIFEGDILHYWPYVGGHRDKGTMGVKLIVKWFRNESAFGYEMATRGPESLFVMSPENHCQYKTEVAGSIHDNLLLKNNTEVTNGTNDSSGVSS